MALRVTQVAEGVRLSLKVVPGASRNRIMGELGETLKVAVSKAPEAGAANKAVIELLAETLGVPRGHVEIVRGQAQPRKEVLIRGIDAETLRSRLSSAT